MPGGKILRGMYDCGMNREQNIDWEMIRRIRERMDRLRLDQKQLSTAVGVATATISRYLSGERRPSAAILRRIAFHLETTTSYLQHDTDNPERDDTPPLPEYAADVLEFMRQLDSSRNYELWLIAQTFATEPDTRRPTYLDLIDAILDIADEDDEEDTNFVIRYLTELERKRTAFLPDSTLTHPDQ